MSDFITVSALPGVPLVPGPTAVAAAVPIAVPSATIAPATTAVPSAPIIPVPASATAPIEGAQRQRDQTSLDMRFVTKTVWFGAVDKG